MGLKTYYQCWCGMLSNKPGFHCGEDMKLVYKDPKTVGVK